MAPLSQAAIARKIGVSKSLVSLVLRGMRNLKYPEAKKLSAIITSDPVVWIHHDGTKEARERAFAIYKEDQCKQ